MIYLSPLSKQSKKFRMILRKYLIACMFLATASVVSGQDLHYTQFLMAPIQTNPANIGGFEGTARVGGIYRGQWNDSDVDGYRQPHIYIDAPIIRGLGKYDWIGVGFAMSKGVAGLSNESGKTNFKINTQHLGVAYHLSLDKNRKNVLAFGLQYGSIGKNYQNVKGLRTPWSLDPRGTPEDPDLLNFFNGIDSTGSTDINFGVTLNSKMDKNSKLTLGIAMAHLNNPSTSFRDSLNNDGIGRRMTAFGQMTRYISNKIRIEPAFILQTQGKAFEAALQGQVGYLIDPKNKIILNAGLGYRVGADGQVLFGIEKDGLKVGASYDINLSGFQSASGLQSAFEIGVGYIIKFHKKPNVKPVIFCPRF